MMSFFGSPISNSYNQEYDFDDDRYEEEDEKENDEQEETDEDTEDASETDTGRQEEPLEIKEQMYQDKLANLKKKLQQLKDGTHYDYNKKVKKLEYQYKERLRLNDLYREYMIECVKRDYAQEIKAAARDFEEKKIDLRETLIADLEDKKRTIEAERLTMELTGDSMEIKPALTRKLRRRPNDPIPLPEKRRKAPAAQITYLLDEKEVENDLRLINKGKISTPVRKLSESSVTSPISLPGIPTTPTVSEVTVIETRIEDGKLLYEKRWFHRGQSIFVEGREMPKFPANISAIGNDCIWVKKSDGSKIRFFISNLARGKISIKRSSNGYEKKVSICKRSERHEFILAQEPARPRPTSFYKTLKFFCESRPQQVLYYDLTEHQFYTPLPPVTCQSHCDRTFIIANCSYLLWSREFLLEGWGMKTVSPCFSENSGVVVSAIEKKFK